jgi:hypothetical protein
VARPGRPGRLRKDAETQRRGNRRRRRRRRRKDNHRGTEAQRAKTEKEETTTAERGITQIKKQKQEFLKICVIC